MFVYLVTLALIYWLSTPEWSAIYRRFSLFCERVVQIPARELLLVLMIGLIGLAVIAVFSSACEPQALYVHAQSIASRLLAAGVLGLTLLMFVVSRRRWQLSSEGATLAAGVFLGGFPQWQILLSPGGLGLASAAQASCPNVVLPHVRLFAREVLPALWGKPPLEGLGWWGVVALLFIIALGLFVWSERAALWSLLTLTPLAQPRQGAAMVGLLFCIPIALAVLGVNTVDVAAGVRYSLITWQASSIVLAIFLARLVGRFKVLGLILIAFFVLQVGTANLAFAATQWSDSDPLYAPEEVSALEDYLTQNNLRRGYADYWDSYTIDFLTNERLTVVPYNGVDRYPQYTEAVAASPKQVFVFRSENSPPDTGRTEDLVKFLSQESAEAGTAFGSAFPQNIGYVFPQIQERLANQVVLQQQRVASWEVWVVTDR